MSEKRAQPNVIEYNERLKKATQARDDFILLTLGEPDFDTPPNVVDAAVKALKSGDTHYASSYGIPELRQAIADKHVNDNGIPCKPEHVMTTPTKYALFTTIQTLFGQGDEVIVPDPAWVSYGPMLGFTGAKPSFVKAGQYGPVADDIMETIGPNTKGIIINSPSNPLGIVYSKEVIEGIADVAKDHDLIVISDEVYEKIVFDGEHISIASLPGMFDRTITVNGLSKAYAMTGWRMGWLAAKEEWVKEIVKMVQHSVTCVPPFVQRGALEALTGDQGPMEAMVDKFRERRAAFIPALQKAPGLNVVPPAGAFYVFPSYDQDIPDFDMCVKLQEAGVGVTPGSMFGRYGEKHFRISFAASMENLLEAAGRITEAFGSL